MLQVFVVNFFHISYAISMKLSLVKFSNKAHTETGVTICIFDILSHQAHL